MAIPGWLDSNKNRCFPFVTDTIGWPIAGPVTLRNLPYETICDFGVNIRNVGFDPQEHKVWLAGIVRTNNTLWFEFRSDCPQLSNQPLIFTRNISDTAYTASYADSDDYIGSIIISSDSYSASGNSASTGSASSGSDSTSTNCYQIGTWWGYLVTGELDNLIALLPNNGDAIVGKIEIEPALIDAQSGWVDNIDLVNDIRTTFTAAPECNGVETDITSLLSARCLSGIIVFRPGYNCTIRADTAKNSVIISGVVGAGEGEPCGDVPLGPNDDPKPGFAGRDGGLGCGQVLRIFNGIEGPQIGLTGQNRVIVTPLPSENTLKITIPGTSRFDCRGNSLSFSQDNSQLGLYLVTENNGAYLMAEDI